MRFKALYMPVALLVTLSLAGGCNQPEPDDLIEESVYIQLLTEMHLLAAMREMTDDAELFRKGQETVLEHYQISREQFDRSHDYYFQDVREQQRRMREVRRKLDETSSDLSDYELEMRQLQNADDM